MERHIKSVIKNRLPDEIEINSVKSGEMEGQYNLRFGWTSTEKEGKVLLVEPLFELLIHGVKYGSFSVENIFDAGSIKNEAIAYSAIINSIATLNSELYKATIGGAFTSETYIPFIYGNYESVASDIRKSLFV